MYSIYAIYLDDGRDVFKLHIPAVCEESAIAWCRGCGKVVAVSDVTEEFNIDGERVFSSLIKSGFSDAEAFVMVRALRELGIADG